MTKRTKFPEDDEFPVESLVISFYLTAAARVIRSAEDEFNTVFLSAHWRALTAEAASLWR